ncbi:MAG: hypothetical protein IT435_07345, partial [Phycisphaerales bacterium]|nr:hypothetical protein [Phycisphaerales bacterium]
PPFVQNVRDRRPRKQVEVWFQDEARVGQQGTLTRQWAPRGSRPRVVRQTEYKWVYIYGAVNPLNESLPKPVIDLPTSSADNSAPPEGASGRRGRRRSGASTESGPVLWEQKDGQITLESPGPIFDEGAAAAKASNGPSPGAIAGQVAAIKTLLGLRKVITNADVQEHLKCDPATARAVLKQLVESGAAVVEGKAKGTKYRAAGKA